MQAGLLCESLHKMRPFSKLFQKGLVLPKCTRVLEISSDASWPALRNFMQDAPFLKTLPEGFGLAEMYTSARYKFDLYIPMVLYAGENNWLVKISHYSNGKIK